MVLSFMAIFILMYAFSAATLDIILSWIAWRSLKFTQKLRYLLKFIVAAAWIVVLPIAYFNTMQNPTGLVKFFSSWAADWQNQSFYNYAIAVYLIPNILSCLLFLLPPLRKRMERSNWRIITFLMWWAQVSMFNIHCFKLKFLFSGFLDAYILSPAHVLFLIAYARFSSLYSLF